MKLIYKNIHAFIFLNQLSPLGIFNSTQHEGLLNIIIMKLKHKNRIKIFNKNFCSNIVAVQTKHGIYKVRWLLWCEGQLSCSVYCSNVWVWPICVGTAEQQSGLALLSSSGPLNMSFIQDTNHVICDLTWG